MEKRSFIEARNPSVDRRFRPRPDRRVNLLELFSEEDEVVSTTSTEDDDTESISSASSNSNNHQSVGALVFLRLRPTNCSTEKSPYEVTGNILVTKQNSVLSNKNFTEKHFTFTDIFESYVEQASVYETCVRNAIETEENLTVLAYGTSGSGKTYTQLGDSSYPGLIPRALEHIFKLYADNIYSLPSVKIVNGSLSILDDDHIRIEEQLRHKLIPAETEKTFHTHVQDLILADHKFETKILSNVSVFVWISFAEIYNEIVYDLLCPQYQQDIKKKNSLKIVSTNGKVYIKNLTSVYVKNSYEAYALLSLGSQRVTYGSTAVNKNSSRSHCVFFIDVITYCYTNIFTQRSYKFCDLAGSERLDKTNNVGIRLKEAQRINTSLLVLGRCLDAVYQSQQQQKKTDTNRQQRPNIVPYRESKLTTLLQAPLLGKEKITMIVNINPLGDYFEENMHVLGFSSIARNIVFKQEAKKQQKTRYSWLAVHAMKDNSTISSKEFDLLYDENVLLKNEIMRLEKELDSQRVALINEFETMLKNKNDLFEKRLAQQEQSLRKMYEARIDVLKVEHKIQLENYSVDISDTESVSSVEIITGQSP